MVDIMFLYYKLRVGEHLSYTECNRDNFSNLQEHQLASLAVFIIEGKPDGPEGELIRWIMEKNSYIQACLEIRYSTNPIFMQLQILSLSRFPVSN